MPLNIDLHTHSFFSGDGISSPEDMIAAARAKGLSGFAITDHNTCDAVNYLLEKGLMRLDGLPVNDFLILPGVEVTTADGHLLCIRAELPYLKGKLAQILKSNKLNQQYQTPRDSLRKTWNNWLRLRRRRKIPELAAKDRSAKDH